MKTTFGICKLIASIFISVIPLQIIAQESAARIYKIAIASKGKIEESRNLTSLAQLKRSNQKNWLNIKKNDELFFNDLLKLEKDIWVKINIKNTRQNGAITVVQKDLLEPGQYRFMESQDGFGDIALDIKQGSAIIQVVKDKIYTNTHGMTSLVRSGSITRALYNVRPDGSGEIYLQQGHLTFPDNTEVPGLKAGQVANFQNGQITKVFFPDLPLTKEYNNFIKFNNSTVWKKPFLKRPGTWAGAAVVGIGTALILNKANKEVTGTIKVNWGTN